MTTLINSNTAVFRKTPMWKTVMGAIVTHNEVITKKDLHEHFGYPVIKERLYTSRMEPTNAYATIRTVFNEDGTDERVILGDKLSEDYHVLQNSELIEALDPLLDAGCILDGGFEINRGRRIGMVLRLPGDLEINGLEQVGRFVFVSNDHTGEQSARVQLMPVRHACTNMMNAADMQRANWIRINHRKNVAASIRLATNLIDVANGQFLAYGDQLEELMLSDINQEDLDLYVKKIFFPKLDAMPDETSEEKENARKEADRLIKMQNTISEIFQTEPSIVDYPSANNTVFGAYQAVNHYLNHVQAIGDARRLHNIGWGTGRQTDIKAFAAARELVHSR